MDDVYKNRVFYLYRNTKAYAHSLYIYNHVCAQNNEWTCMLSVIWYSPNLEGTVNSRQSVELHSTEEHAFWYTTYIDYAGRYGRRQQHP